MVAPSKSVMFNLRTNYCIRWEGSRKMTENLNISNVILDLTDKKNLLLICPRFFLIFHLLTTISYRPVNKLSSSNYLFRRRGNIYTYFFKIPELIPLHRGIRISKMLWSSVMDRRQITYTNSYLSGLFVCTYIYIYIYIYICIPTWLLVLSSQ